RYNRLVRSLSFFPTRRSSDLDFQRLFGSVYTLGVHVRDQNCLTVIDTRGSSGGLSKRPPHSLLQSVSAGSGDHLVLRENDGRIWSQCKPLTRVPVLVEENLVGCDTAGFEGVMPDLNSLLRDQVYYAGNDGRVYAHGELGGARGVRGGEVLFVCI